MVARLDMTTCGTGHEAGPEGEVTGQRLIKRACIFQSHSLELDANLLTAAHYREVRTS